MKPLYAKTTKPQPQLRGVWVLNTHYSKLRLEMRWYLTNANKKTDKAASDPIQC